MPTRSLRNIYFTAVALIALALGILSPRGAGVDAPHAVAADPIRVAVHQELVSQGSAAELAAQLNDDTFFDFTPTIVTATQIDTVAELLSYDVVIIGDSGYSDNGISLAMATALKDWAQFNGGGVVSVSWLDYFMGSMPANAATDAVLDDVMPTDAYPNGAGYCGNPVTIQIVDNSHPVTTGLSDFLLPSSQYVTHSPFAPDATNGAVLATASAGCNEGPPRNTVVVGELGSGHLVYLGPLYNGFVTDYTNGDLRTGAPDRLLEQAVAWAAGPQASNDDNERSRSRNNVGGAIAGIFGNPNATATKPAVVAAAAPATGALKPPSTGDGGLADENP